MIFIGLHSKNNKSNCLRVIHYRRAFARGRIKRCVILGLDGMDSKLAEKFTDEGKLPTLDSLRKQGTFKPLATTIPSMSPVAWSSFQTGVNPGKHNIYDFLTRDKQTYAPKLSSVDIRRYIVAPPGGTILLRRL